jgi:drug/metabolite transporter (DMT)-like permease
VTSVVLAVAASLGWGSSDFLGGLAARRARIVVVLAGSQLSGLVLFVPVLVWLGQPLPRDVRLLLGVAAGVIAVAELGLIYLALLRSSSMVMAPIAALSALVPVAVGIASGDHLDAVIAIGIMCALSGAVGASWNPPHHRGSRREGLTAACVSLGAALGAGSVLTLIGTSSKAGTWWTIGAVRAGGAVTACLLFATIVIIKRLQEARLRTSAISVETSPLRPRSRRHSSPSLAVVATVVAIGLSDLVADTAFANATRNGALSIVSVLASLYPLTTIALGAVVLHERHSRVQLAGAAIASVGIAILAATT